MEEEVLGSFLPPGAGAVANLALKAFGAHKQKSAAEKQAELQEEYTQRAYEYDVEKWNQDWQRLKADRYHALEGFRKQARNENRVAALRNASNEQQYIYDLTIRNREQNSLETQYNKSNVLFEEQISANARAAETASESEWRQLEEINAEAAFDAQEQRLDYLATEGKLRAAATGGRSSDKVQQSAMAAFGLQVAALNEGLASAGRNTKAMLKEIQDDKYSANLAAFAQKMLDPGELPMPIVPFEYTPTELDAPRELDEAFDKGPRPVKGARASASAASAAVWGKALPSIASSIGDVFQAFSKD